MCEARSESRRGSVLGQNGTNPTQTPYNGRVGGRGSQYLSPQPKFEATSTLVMLKIRFVLVKGAKCWYTN